MKKVRLIGMTKVMSALKKEVKSLENRTQKGLIIASIHLRRDMENTSPTIPIDFNNLRASWFTTSKGGQDSPPPTFKEDDGTMAADHAAVLAQAKAITKEHKYPLLVMGFSANYALWVHENEGAKFKRPGSGAKFFEAALNRNHAQMLQIIKDNSKIP